MNIVKVWNTLSIRTQLIVFMTLLITLLEAGTLLVINQLEKKTVSNLLERLSRLYRRH